MFASGQRGAGPGPCPGSQGHGGRARSFCTRAQGHTRAQGRAARSASRPPPSCALGGMSMCWDVCNLSHAALPPREHTQPRQPRHTVTHSDTRWRPAPGARPSLGDAPATHTHTAASALTPTFREESRSRRAAPSGPAALLFCSLPAPGPQRAGGDELTPPPAGLPA